MTTPDDDPIAQRRFAFRLVPLCEHTANGWRTYYPGAGWSITAASEDESRHQFAQEVERRRDAGQNPMAHADAIYRQHVQEHPVPGVFAMDSQLYRYLIREIGYDAERLQEVFEESERRRAHGEAYTKDDYLRDHPG
jgi:hypothetical protein